VALLAVASWSSRHDGAEVNFACYLNLASDSGESAARHRLLLDVMRLTQEIGVKVA
jgi:hypothetical protein